MKTLRIKSMLIGFVLSIPALHTSGQDARTIVQKANDLAMGKTSIGEMTMTIERPSWSRAVSMKSWSKGTEYYLILITEPARDKGQVFLKRQTDMWNYMPSIARMIKIPPSMMNQSWMGSDFTNNDLVKMNSLVEDYSHKITGNETVGGFDCYKVELMPLEEAAVVWGKIVMWIAKNEYYEMKAEFYDEDMNLVNTQYADDIRHFGDRSLPAHMEMIPAGQEGHKTILELQEMKFNVDLPNEFFSQQNMQKVK